MKRRNFTAATATALLAGCSARQVTASSNTVAETDKHTEAPEPSETPEAPVPVREKSFEPLGAGIRVDDYWLMTIGAPVVREEVTLFTPDGGQVRESEEGKMFVIIDVGLNEWPGESVSEQPPSIQADEFVLNLFMEDESTVESVELDNGVESVQYRSSDDSWQSRGSAFGEGQFGGGLLLFEAPKSIESMFLLFRPGEGREFLGEVFASEAMWAFEDRSAYE